MSTFEELFTQQRLVSATLFRNAVVGPEERRNRILLALTAEVGELVNACADEWKWWAGQSRSDPADELTDAFLFVILLAIDLNIEPEDLLRRAATRLAAFDV